MGRLNKLTSEEVTKHTRCIFARHGITELVVSDNGRQFSEDLYASFAQKYGFEHITSSRHYLKGMVKQRELLR